MINPEVQNLIETQFKQLPEVVQDVILNSNWQEKIRHIVTNNKLHIDQGAAIENLVFITMLGMERPDDFVENAKEYAKVSEEVAYSISGEVERSIFAEIRKKLIDITETHDSISEIDRVADEVSKEAGEDVEQKPLVSMGANKKSLAERLPRGSLVVRDGGAVPAKPAPTTEQAPGAASEAKTNPTPSISTESQVPQKPAFKPVPKIIAPTIDPIVAASLAGPKTSAKEILEMEAIENTPKNDRRDVPVQPAPTSAETKPRYDSSDPYRETVE